MGGYVGPSSIAGGRRGSKRHLIVDAGGILLNLLVDAVPPMRDGAVSHADARGSCSPTAAMTPTHSAGSCGRAGHSVHPPPRRRPRLRPGKPVKSPA
jgi:hypothetical protein